MTSISDCDGIHCQKSNYKTRVAQCYVLYSAHTVFKLSTRKTEQQLNRCSRLKMDRIRHCLSFNAIYRVLRNLLRGLNAVGLKGGHILLRHPVLSEIHSSTVKNTTSVVHSKLSRCYK